MMLQTIEGNLITLALEGKFDMIAHGCNCFHTMGGGIAKSISETFPEALQADRVFGERGNVWKLGQASKATIFRGDTQFVVVNLYTQFEPGANFEYLALINSLEHLKKYLDIHLYDRVSDKPYRLGFPKIGAGIGGGDWDQIYQIIDQSLDEKYREEQGVEITVVEFIPPNPLQEIVVRSLQKK